MVVYDLFMDDDVALIVGTKRGRKEELQDPTIDCQQAQKRASSDLVMSTSVDEWRHDKMAVGASFSHIPPPHPSVEQQHALVEGESNLDA